MLILPWGKAAGKVVPCVTGSLAAGIMSGYRYIWYVAGNYSFASLHEVAPAELCCPLPYTSVRNDGFVAVRNVMQQLPYCFVQN